MKSFEIDDKNEIGKKTLSEDEEMDDFLFYSAQSCQPIHFSREQQVLERGKR